MRLGALADGVMRGVPPLGVLIEVAAERELSRLLDRLEEEGDTGTASGADILSVAVCNLVPLRALALRPSARSLLCNVKKCFVELGSRIGSTGSRIEGSSGSLRNGMVEVFRRRLRYYRIERFAGSLGGNCFWWRLVEAQVQRAEPQCCNKYW